MEPRYSHGFLHELVSGVFEYGLAGVNLPVGTIGAELIAGLSVEVGALEAVRVLVEL